MKARVTTTTTINHGSDADDMVIIIKAPQAHQLRPLLELQERQNALQRRRSITGDITITNGNTSDAVDTITNTTWRTALVDADVFVSSSG